MEIICNNFLDVILKSLIKYSGVIKYFLKNILLWSGKATQCFKRIKECITIIKKTFSLPDRPTVYLHLTLRFCSKIGLLKFPSSGTWRRVVRNFSEQLYIHLQSNPRGLSEVGISKLLQKLGTYTPISTASYLHEKKLIFSFYIWRSWCNRLV